MKANSVTKGMIAGLAVMASPDINRIHGIENANDNIFFVGMLLTHS